MKVTAIRYLLTTAVLVGTTLVADMGSAQILFQENFDGLTLGPFVSTSETGGDGTDWTDALPTGWTRDNTDTPVGGPVEFFGLTVLDIVSWDATAAQDRALFTLASGGVLVGDGDEYDDDAGNGNVLGSADMNVFVETAPTPFSTTGILNVSWSNDFRAFDASQATIEASYDGGATFPETVYSITGTDERNTAKSALLNNPASGTLVLRFGYTNANNDWWWAVDNIVVEELQFLPTLDLSVDRTDGSLTLSNQTGGPVNLSGYQITSEFEGLDPANWVSIADNYDGDSSGTVDGTNDWTELTQAGANGDLSEGDLESGSGGSLAAGQSINLGNAGTWIRSPNEDLVLSYISDGAVVTGIVNFEIAAPPYVLGDVDTDGDIDAADWGIVRSNQQTDLSGNSLAEAYRLGDLTGDLQNNHPDFVAFKDAFDAANGLGAFSAMIASVPEPSTVLLVMMGGLFALPAVGRRETRE